MKCFFCNFHKLITHGSLLILIFDTAFELACYYTEGPSGAMSERGFNLCHKCTTPHYIWSLSVCKALKIFIGKEMLFHFIRPAGRGKHNDEIRLGVWHTEYKALFSFMLQSSGCWISCWWNTILKILGFLIRGFSFN